jgi:phosphoenolpyruvate phosphomutase
MNEWGNRHPVVIVPTKYYSVPTERFRELGIGMAIWANHNLRASIQAMQKTSSQIFHEQSLLHVEGAVSPLQEVFRLQNEEELEESEKIYLSTSKQYTKSIILVRQQDDQLLLNDQIHLLKTAGMKDIVQVKENDCGEVYSLYSVKDKIAENTIISSSDIIYKAHVLDELMEEKQEITIVVDCHYEPADQSKTLVTAKLPYSKMLYGKTVDLVTMSKKLDDDEIHGEFMGLWKVSGKGATILKEALEELSQRTDFNELTLENLFNYVQNHHPIAVKYISGSWLNMETYKKLHKAGEEP